MATSLIATSLPAAAALSRWGQRLRKRENRVFLVLTLLIGALVGLTVVAFILVTERAGALLFPVGSAPWRRLLMPILGAGISGILLQRYFPNSRGSGIPQTKVALYVHGGRIDLRTVLGRFLCSSIALSGGVALGREGPSVQLGGGIASIIGQKLGLSPEKLRALIPVGASAAIAAAFNTPIAAVLFSLEEVMGNLHAPVIGSVVISAAVSWVVMHLFLGDEPLFHVPAYQLVHPVEFLIYAVLGILGGFVSVTFVKLTLELRRHFRRLPGQTRWAQPMVGGLVVGAFGWFVPDLLGVGYDTVGQVLNGEVTVRLVLMLLVLKMIASSTCFSSGNAGGIFGPSLFFGAMLGGGLGRYVHEWFPLHTGTPGAYALVGMGCTFAGIIRVPLTSVFMIFELTRDYSIVVPLMIANLISFYISSRLQPEPIYEAIALQDGIHLPPGGGAARIGGRWTVEQVMSPQSELVPPLTTVGELAGDSADVMVGEQQQLWGVAPAPAIADARAHGDLHRRVVELLPVNLHLGGDTQAEHFPHVHPDHALDVALERLEEQGLVALPVLDRADVRRLRGVITRDDILRTYRGEEGAG